MTGYDWLSLAIVSVLSAWCYVNRLCAQEAARDAARSALIADRALRDICRIDDAGCPEPAEAWEDDA